MSINRKNELDKSVFGDYSHSVMYPWKKLHKLGYDNLWVDANSDHPPGILRRPSVLRHPSFDSLPSCKDETSNKTSPTSKNEFSYDSAKALLEKEMEVQDDYIKYKFGLYRYQIIPDGNCMYRALAQALAHDQNQHCALRKEIVTFIKEHPNDFKPIIEGSLSEFVKQALKPNTWGSYVELLAATKLLSINIVIVTGGCPSNPDVNVTCHHYNPDDNSITPKDTVWLSWLSNGHYDVIVDRKMKNRDYERWLSEKNHQVTSDARLAEALAHEDDAELWKFTSSAASSNTVPADAIPSTSSKAFPTSSDSSNTCTRSGASASDNPTEAEKHWTIEDDEQLARSLQEAEEVFAFYGLQ